MNGLGQLIILVSIDYSQNAPKNCSKNGLGQLIILVSMQENICL
jgi:hypothetical protein